MRISSNSDDAGYGAFCAVEDKSKIRVFLDGTELSDTSVADEERGIVVMAIRGKDGRFLAVRPTRESDGEFATVELHSWVSVKTDGSDIDPFEVSKFWRRDWPKVA